MKFIEGIHVHKVKSGIMKINQKKTYIWTIPEKLEKECIEKGDLVLVRCKNTKAPVVVLNVFDNKFDDIKHKTVIKVLEKVKK